MNIEFGVPSQRNKTIEQYPTQPVLTVLAIAEKKGSSKKVAFNKTAITELGFEEDSNVSISFSGHKTLLVNTSGMELSEALKITKGSPRSFSSSKYYGYISKLNNLDNSVDNDFSLVKVENEDYEGRDVYELSPLKITTAEATTVEVTEDAEEDGDIAPLPLEIDTTSPSQGEPPTMSFE